MLGDTAYDRTSGYACSDDATNIMITRVVYKLHEVALLLECLGRTGKQANTCSLSATY